MLTLGSHQCISNQLCSQLLSKSGWTHVGHYFGWTTLTTPKWMHIFKTSQLFYGRGSFTSGSKHYYPPYVAKQLTAQFHTQSPFSCFGYCCIVPSVPLVDLLNGLLWAGRNGLPPTPDTLHLGCSYHLHSSHHFLSTLGVGFSRCVTLIWYLGLGAGLKIWACASRFALATPSPSDMPAWYPLWLDHRQLSLKYLNSVTELLGDSVAQLVRGWQAIC